MRRTRPTPFAICVFIFGLFPVSLAVAATPAPKTKTTPIPTAPSGTPALESPKKSDLPFTLAPLFSDRMVLQRERKIKIWGTAREGLEIAIRLTRQSAKAGDGAPITTVQVARTIATNGKWSLMLEPLSPGDPITLTVSSGDKSLTLRDILVGDVFLGAGQSNMAFQLASSDGAKSFLPATGNPNIRLCSIPLKVHEGDGVEARPQWTECTPATAAKFSAVLYFFGSNLQPRLGIPVGLVNCSHGNTLAECYISSTNLIANEHTRPIWDSYQNFLARTYKESQDVKYRQDLEAYLAAVAAGQKAKRPKAVYGGPLSHRRPGGLYETMVASQIGPFTFRGVVWYQAEANAREERGWQFRHVLQVLVENWRDLFGDPDLPFLFVQPPAFQDSMVPWPTWAETRDSILVASQTIPKTAMVVAIDYPGIDPKNIHPERKGPVGARFALAARHLIYGETNLACRGPRVKAVSFQGAAATLTFSEAASGLVLKDGTNGAFTLCGADGVFKEAVATLNGPSLVVTSADVPQPVAVRYGWANFFTPVLYDREGLPASPFRSDDFEMVSRHNLEIEGSSSEN